MADISEVKLPDNSTYDIKDKTARSAINDAVTMTFADVATSGSYNDLNNKPTIPIVTLNGASTTSPSFYAPTSAGTSGQVLTSNGSGAPTWGSAPASGPWEDGSGSYSAQIPDGGADASGDYAVAEGKYTTADGEASHAEGYESQAIGNYSHAEGGIYDEEADDIYAGGLANADGAHAEGASTTASGKTSHAEGYGSIASGFASHAEGGLYDPQDEEGGYYSTGGHASGDGSHAEGILTTASGWGSHAEGIHTTASAFASHAEGWYTAASNSYAHAEGQDTIAQNMGEHASGRYNSSTKTNNVTFGNAGNTHFSVGIGINSATRSNALEIMQNGDMYVKGVGSYTGAYASSGIKSLQTVLSEKQATLVSGTNIKTINNESILGSGNITISGGSGSSGVTGVILPDGTNLVSNGVATIPIELPSVSSSDNGMVLTVVNGAWAAAALNTQTYYTGSSTPTSSFGNNGDLYLQIDES